MFDKRKRIKRNPLVVLLTVMSLLLISCGRRDIGTADDAGQNQINAEAGQNSVEDNRDNSEGSQTNDEDNRDNSEDSKTNGGENQDNTEERKISVVDQAGRTVELEKPAETVVSCYYISSYAAMALGIPEKVVGIEKKADSRPVYHMAQERFLSLPAVGTMKELDVEAVAALKPDIIIMPKKLKDYADTLEKLGIKSVVVNPESQEELEEMLRLMGKVCGAETQAEKLIDYYSLKKDEIKKYTTNVEHPKTCICSNSSYLAVAPADMYQSSILRIAGGENAADGLEGDYWTDISYEKMLAMNPDVIIIPCGAAYSREDIMADKNLSAVSAVKNGKIYMMPQNIEEWDSPIPSGILGMLWMTTVLNPETYSYEKFQNDVVEFYSNFYGFGIDKKLITKPDQTYE